MPFSAVGPLSSNCLSLEFRCRCFSVTCPNKALVLLSTYEWYRVSANSINLVWYRQTKTRLILPLMNKLALQHKQDHGFLKMHLLRCFVQIKHCCNLVRLSCIGYKLVYNVVFCLFFAFSRRCHHDTQNGAHRHNKNYPIYHNRW